MRISGLALVALFLGSMLGIPTTMSQTPSPSCADYDDDRAYLMDVNVAISPGPHGPTVEVTRASDGTVLRQSFPDSEKFYVDYSGGNLVIRYRIVAQCGGFDVIYALKNPAPPWSSWADTQPQPELRVEGLRMATTGDVYMLRTKDFGNVLKLPLTNNNGYPNTFFSIGPYPGMTYAPVMVAHDSVLSVGSALHYPVLAPGYRNAVWPALERVLSGPQEGTWKHRYLDFYEDAGGAPAVPTTIGPGEQREYKVTVRFAGPQFWLQTLFPYKQYFQSLYSASSDIYPRDRRPVFATATAVLMDDDDPRWRSNPRSFTPYIGVDGHRHRLDIDGWGPFTATTISDMTTLGYERVMIWAPSGLFGPNSPFNFPPQFMSDWLPMPLRTEGELSAFAEHKLSLGMWWGRSSQIPVPIQWNPKTLVDARLNNPAHVAFLTNELKLAYARGSNDVGLDAFVQMPTYERYLWVDQMKRIAPGISLIHEGAGADVMHSKMANYYHSVPWNGQPLNAPDVLSAYLNPGSPIWVQAQWETWVNREAVQNLVQWGFTPVVRTYPEVDVNGLDDTLVACFDGLDNDQDGLVDWPYDPGCATAADRSEKPISPRLPGPIIPIEPNKAWD